MLLAVARMVIVRIVVKVIGAIHVGRHLMLQARRSCLVF